MKFKGLSVILACVCCLSMPMQVNAAEVDSTTAVATAVTEEVQPLAAGLISGCSLSCTKGTKTVYITAKTTGNEEMSEIGFIDIKIQRSSDLTSWTTEKTVSDKIKEDASTYSLANYAVTVQGGYYYRVTLTHYAKEQTWFLGNVVVDYEADDSAQANSPRKYKTLNMELGDVNYDGVLTSDDATLILNSLILNTTLSNFQKDLADCDQNGYVDVNDAYVLQTMIPDAAESQMTGNLIQAYNSGNVELLKEYCTF